MPGIFDILGSISNIIGAVGARQQGIEMANTQLQGGYSHVGTEGGAVPAGGFRLTPEIQTFLSQHNEGVDKNKSFLDIGNFFAGRGGSATETLSGNVQTVDQANDLVDAVRKTNPAMADALAAEFNKQLGGQPLSFGAADVKGALIGDYKSQSEAAAADWARQQEGLATLKTMPADIEAARRHVSEGTASLIADSRKAQQDAVDSLDLAKVGSIMQLADNVRLRREVMSNFQDDATRAMETERGAMNNRFRQEDEDLANRMANDPEFANRPDLAEYQKASLKHNHVIELTDSAGKLRVQYDGMRSQLDMSTAQMESQSAIAAAGEFGNISGLEANLKTHYADTRRDAEANLTQVNVSLDLLDQQNKVQVADYLRSMTQTVVPYAPVLQMAMGLDIAVEDRANALKFGGEAAANAFWGQVGGTLLQLGAIGRQEEQQAANEKAQKDATTMGYVGMGTKLAGTAFTAFAPVAAPAATAAPAAATGATAPGAMSGGVALGGGQQYA